MMCARIIVVSVLVAVLLPFGVGNAVGQSVAVSDARVTEGTATRRKLLEDAFEATMTGVTFEGTWRMTGKGGLTARGPLGAAAADKYTIVGVSKGIEDSWVVNARIEFGDKDVTVPILVRVVWAGDTPVITLDNLAIPLIGTYSARVMIHNGFYSGIWYSNVKNYGGVMSGRIVKQASDHSDKATPKSTDGGE